MTGGFCIGLQLEEGDDDEYMIERDLIISRPAIIAVSLPVVKREALLQVESFVVLRNDRQEGRTAFPLFIDE